MSDRPHHIDRLYRQEQGRLLRVARQRVGHAAAPDVVQDVFMAMWARAKDAIELTPAYLVRATQFTAISLFRSEKRRAATLKTIVEEQYCAPVILPDQIVAARQDLRRLQEVIESLPSRTKQVFLLRRMHDCTYHEIALGLGISYSTVEREMGRALLACKALEAGDGDCGSAW
ncbi:RNA polymerase sigma-70 factor (ECF subfamily) [Agrobacterium vitis]|nr:RNA polymerase sigma-70 factor (ECF subfamily) [Agrobacterium vitis]MBE1440208.1 RNA polymerase sigma-70 factor (ECF subfamily) [Agrobacterium vitis]